VSVRLHRNGAALRTPYTGSRRDDLGSEPMSRSIAAARSHRRSASATAMSDSQQHRILMAPLQPRYGLLVSA
jgi:hypothetical protein